MPPNQGSVKEKFVERNALPLLCTRILNFCPSPIGSGSQADFLKIFLEEKLLKVTPKVPVNPI